MSSSPPPPQYCQTVAMMWGLGNSVIRKKPLVLYHPKNQGYTPSRIWFHHYSPQLWSSEICVCVWKQKEKQQSIVVLPCVTTNMRIFLVLSDLAKYFTEIISKYHPPRSYTEGTYIEKNPASTSSNWVKFPSSILNPLFVVCFLKRSFFLLFSHTHIHPPTHRHHHRRKLHHSHITHTHHTHAANLHTHMGLIWA